MDYRNFGDLSRGRARVDKMQLETCIYTIEVHRCRHLFGCQQPGFSESARAWAGSGKFIKVVTVWTGRLPCQPRGL